MAATRVEQVVQPTLGPRGWSRWAWRQLTSMRTALFLLLMLAVGALPGSIWPQRSIDANRTATYLQDHPRLGPWLDRLGMFDVYASPWFSAIYLLLLLSLIGCVLPRGRIHWKALRSVPPRAPSRLDRLPAHATVEVDSSPEQALAAARESLGRRYRVTAHDDVSLSSETGYLKETGNLLFHLAIIGVIVGVAVGHVYGWKGDVIVPVGEGFANTQISYDTFSPGPLVDADDLPPFSLTVDRFDATFEDKVTGRGQFGAPRDFTAYVTTTEEPGAAPVKHVLAVNHPIELDGAGIFLLGNGYAPVVTVRDREGRVLYTGATPFLARDDNYTSVGAIKVPGASPKELGFFGNFLPTAVITTEQGPISVFPDARNPALALGLYEGELNPGGRSGSVYTLNTKEMTQVKDAAGQDFLRLWLTPGQTITLPGDRGSITFDRVERFAGLSIRHDPAKNLTLLSALLALSGLIATLLVRRRRVFVRVTPLERGSQVVVGGLSKTDDPGLGDVVAALARSVADRA